jgi:membrane-bound serine protease (ClpP class)
VAAERRRPADELIFRRQTLFTPPFSAYNPAMKQDVFIAVLICLVLAGVPAGEAHAQDEPAGNRWADFAAPGARLIEEGWFPPADDVEKPPLPETVTTVFVIPIQGPIDTVTAKSVERKIMHAKGRGAELVIFEMDTPGGRSDAMSEIVQLIRDDLRDVYTVAYVNPDAFSAGAIISLAANEIVMSPAGVIGDAMPIMLGPQGIQEIPEKERGKFESAARAEVRTLARANGYNETLCEAMVTITMEVWLIRHQQTGELKIVDASEWRGRVHGIPPDMNPPEQVADDSPWEYLEELDGPNELVTLTAREATRLGFAPHVFDDMEALKDHYRVVTKATRLGDTWSEDLVGFLTSPLVSGLLFMVMLLMIYLEMHTPGFMGFGAIAVACLLIMVGSQYLIGLAQWWEIAALVLGVLLIAAEVFIIPGFGVAGIAGFLLCGAALLAMIIPNAPDQPPLPVTDLDWSRFFDGLMFLLLGFIGALLVGSLLSRYLPEVTLLQKSRLILAPPMALAASDPQQDTAPFHRIQPGDIGRSETSLHPVGEVRFGQDLLDAVSDSGYIEGGKDVRVLRRDGNRIVVEEVDA